MSRWFANVQCPRPDCAGIVCVTGRDHDRNFSPCCYCGAGDWTDEEQQHLDRCADTRRESPDPRAYDGPDTLKEM